MKERLGIVGAAIALHLLLYGAAVPYAFSWDDRTVVLGSPEVTGRVPLLSAFSRSYNPYPFRESTEALQYRPFAVASLGLNARLSGLSPGPMRLTNVLLAGAGAGLFGVLLLSIGAPSFVAWTTTCLLSCHPVRSEPILCIVGRSELLAFLAVVGALLARRRPVLSGLLLLAGLLSKENAFVAPALLALLLAVDPESRSELHLASWRPYARRLMPLAVSWGTAFALAAGARLLVLGSFLTGSTSRISPADNVLAALSCAGRLEGAVSLLPLAVARLVWPTVLSPDYSRTTFRAADLLAPSAVALGALGLLAAASLAAASFLLPALRRRAPLAGFGIAWALASYLPFANLLFLTGVAFTERLLFLPAAGVAVCAAALLSALRGPAGASALRRMAPALGVLFLALLGGARIVEKLPDWRDDRSLMEAMARDLPENSKAWWNLTLLSLQEEKTAEAASHLARALALDENCRVQATELVAHAERIGRKDQAEALAAVLGAATPGRRSPAP